MNTLYITPTAFKAVQSGHVTYGFVMHDERSSAYDASWPDMNPPGDMGVLDRVLHSKNAFVRNMLNSCISFKSDVQIGFQHYTWEDVARRKMHFNPVDEYPYVATRMINRKDIQTHSCREAIQLAAVLVPERKRFLWKTWTITKNGKVVDMARFEGVGGDWAFRVKCYAAIMDGTYETR